MTTAVNGWREPEVNSCVNTGQPLGRVTSELKRLLEEKSTETRPADCSSCASSENIDQAIP